MNEVQLVCELKEFERLLAPYSESSESERERLLHKSNGTSVTWKSFCVAVLFLVFPCDRSFSRKLVRESPRLRFGFDKSTGELLSG